VLKIFQYDSKFNQILLVAADMIVLNVLYVLCCLPIFTIGAAQAGLYTGIKVLMDTEDDSSCAKAFFRGFRSGFGKITLVHCIFSVLIAALVLLLMNILVWQYAGFNAPVWMVVTALIMAITFHAQMAPFHASFGCTVMQLLRNVFLVTMAHPFQALIITAAMYLPVALLLLFPGYFAPACILFISIYFSGVYLLAFTLMKKPFRKIREVYLASQEEAAKPAEE
jgi:uncharacterized membrane protein YesL